ncbi:hypothetical protein L917_11508 [Phytophthora nicotianae]|uniref:Uncharacterized protein n=1 Tax=Phytophthora nicotianae TaxID=4792 RepID=W2KWM1_PHYNI|nr:hypothetical protein L917_11508 [Phytophthora nicotianae]
MLAEMPAEVPAEVPAQTVPEEEAAPTKAEPAVDAEVSEVMAAVLSQVSIVPVVDAEVSEVMAAVLSQVSIVPAEPVEVELLFGAMEIGAEMDLGLIFSDVGSASDEVCYLCGDCG